MTVTMDDYYTIITIAVQTGDTNTMNADANNITETILALERAAMERYNKGDVDLKIFRSKGDVQEPSAGRV
jgi:hypothetical protein